MYNHITLIISSRCYFFLELTFLSAIFGLLFGDFFFLAGCGVDLFLITGLDFFFLTNGTFSSESSSSLSSLWYEKKSIHLRNVHNLGWAQWNLGTIQVIRHQRGGWVRSENDNSWWFTVLQIIKELGGWAQKVKNMMT